MRLDHHTQPSNLYDLASLYMASEAFDHPTFEIDTRHEKLLSNVMEVTADDDKDDHRDQL